MTGARRTLLKGLIGTCGSSWQLLHLYTEAAHKGINNIKLWKNYESNLEVDN